LLAHLSKFMQKIQYIKNYKNKKAGDTELVGNNIAHGLIENGVAILFRNHLMRSPVDKMMRAEEPKKREKKRYRTK